MAKLSTKKQQTVKPEQTEEPKPEYVKNTAFGDVGKITKKFGKYLVADFKVKGEIAITFTDTIVPITENEYKATLVDAIEAQIISVYKSGRPVDDWSLGMATHREQDGSVSSVSEKTSPILKDKVEKKMIDLGTDKASIRASINSKTVDQIQLLCAKLNIDAGKYKHLSGGLLKMSLVNVVLGKITNYLSTGIWDLNKMKEELS